MTQAQSSQVTPVEAAKMLNSPLSYIYSLLWQGGLKGEKNGGRWRVSEQSIRELLKRRKERGEK